MAKPGIGGRTRASSLRPLAGSLVQPGHHRRDIGTRRESMLSDRLSTFATNARVGCTSDLQIRDHPGRPSKGWLEVAAKRKAQAAVSQPLSLDKSMAAVLAMLVADREDRLNGTQNGDPRKTELVLATAGLQAAEIAPLVGKNAEAVRKAIQRGRAK